MQTVQKAVTGINESKEVVNKAAAAAVKTYGSVSLTAGKTIEKPLVELERLLARQRVSSTKLMIHDYICLSVTGGILITGNIELYGVR